MTEFGEVVELVYTTDLKSVGGPSLAGSSPAFATNLRECSSVVERLVANEMVVSSNLTTRSNFLKLWIIYHILFVWLGRELLIPRILILSQMRGALFSKPVQAHLL